MATVTVAPTLSPAGFTTTVQNPKTKVDLTKFLFSSAEFTKVQLYVYTGATLPRTMADLKTRLKLKSDETTKFEAMVRAYDQISGHCDNFNRNIFPPSVDLASYVGDYAGVVVDYLDGVNGLLDEIEAAEKKGDASTTAKKRQDMIDAFSDMKSQAEENAKKAAAVRAAMVGFASDTKLDDANLKQATDQIVADLTKEGGEIDRLKRQLKEDTDEYNNANDEYHKWSLVGETTPTYCWLWPIGCVAAPIVAGFAAWQAIEFREAREKYQKLMQQDEGELERDIKLKLDIELCKTSLVGLKDTLEAALPVIEKFESCWTLIKTELEELIDHAGSMKSASDFMLRHKLPSIQQEWSVVSRLATNYVAVAYISVKTAEEIVADPKNYKIPSMDDGKKS